MNFAAMIPVRFRRAIYAIVGLLAALQPIWHFIPAAYEGRSLTTLTVLGFGVALGNTGNTSKPAS